MADQGPESPASRPVPRTQASAFGRAVYRYAAGLAIVATSTCAAWFVFGQSDLADVVMVLLLGVVIVSMRFGYGPSLLAAILSALAFEFYFLPPFFSLAIANLRHIVTFAVMLVVAFVISHLTKRVHDQADTARESERRTGSLYAASRALGGAHTRDELLASAARHVREVFGTHVSLMLPHDHHGLELVADRPLGPDDGQLLEAFQGLIGAALERNRLAEDARRASLRAETEQLRNALLSSVSHDLRTPLAVVTGATSALLAEHAPRDEASRRTLLETAHQEALRLNRLVRNLLDMARLEAGALKVRRELGPLEEVIGSALHRLDDRLRGREIDTNIPADLPLVPFDPVLVEQVLINLLENATKYTPPGTPIDVSAVARDGTVETEVADRGPGVAKGNAERVFEKFYRARQSEGGGVGLGLTICRGIVRAHGGRIWVADRPGGGASFRFTLPLDASASQGSPQKAGPTSSESAEPA
jgi:two-component system, OmpR family, sensor histidine kinase KdpD